RAQALGETYADRVGLLAPSLQRDAGGDVRIPQARAVEVQREARRVSHVGYRLQLLQRPDAAAAAVVRVLHRDGALPRVVIALARPEHGLHRIGGEDAARAVDHQRLHAPQGGDRAAFVVHHVAVAVADDLLTLPGERAEGDLVGHGAG